MFLCVNQLGAVNISGVYENCVLIGRKCVFY